MNAKYIPYFIIGGLFSFMGYIVFLVIGSTNASVHFQTENYYQESVDYQTQIDAQKAANAAGQLTTMVFENTLSVALPSSLIGVSGEILMMRPSDANLDQTLPLQGTKQNIDVSALKKGTWIVKINAKRDGVAYAFEKEIEI